MDDEFVPLSLRAAARLAGVCRTTIVRWMKEGFIESRDPRAVHRDAEGYYYKNPRKIVYQFIPEDLIVLRNSTRSERMSLRRADRDVLVLDKVKGQVPTKIRHPSTSSHPREPDEKTRAMTYEAAARYAGVSLSSISRWISEGIIPEEDARENDKGFRVFDLDTLDHVAQASKDGTLKPGQIKKQKLKARFREAGLELDEFSRHRQVKRGEYSTDTSKWDRVFSAKSAWLESVREYGADDVGTKQLEKLFERALAELA